MLSGLSTVSFESFLPTLSVGDRARPRQRARPREPHESKGAPGHAAASGLRASRTRMQSVLNVYTKATANDAPHRRIRVEQSDRKDHKPGATRRH